jgi:hypothetical protein
MFAFRSLTAIVSLGTIIGCASGTDAEPKQRTDQAALGSCTSGDRRDADDGCNTCECVGGRWQCTELGCETPGSTSTPTPTPTATPTPKPGEPSSGPDSGAGPFAVDEDPGGPVCNDGDQIDAGDGCNTCTCHAGEYVCTELACAPAPSTPTQPPPPPPKTPACKDGDEKTAPDGCNWCFCDDGEWWCTQLGCVP